VPRSIIPISSTRKKTKLVFFSAMRESELSRDKIKNLLMRRIELEFPGYA
jgi:hypothetical protein